MAADQRVDIAVLEARDARSRVDDGTHHEIDSRRFPSQCRDQRRHDDEVAIVGHRNGHAAAGGCGIEG